MNSSKAEEAKDYIVLHIDAKDLLMLGLACMGSSCFVNIAYLNTIIWDRPA
ncbi:MAG TPA: hypothetical protein PLT87_00520 [Spirochaetales bacterium]|nr:hypothetical protein [Spirochaetales bacterium]